MLTKPTIDFLEDLKENNNREWFTAQRKRYEQAKAEFEKTVEEILHGLAQFQENLVNTKTKDCIFRINRDVRFSKDKSPYKQWFAAAFGAGGRKSGKMDFYLHIQPNETFLGGGMWNPTPAQLSKLRQEIDYNAEELLRIIENENFKKAFPVIWGESLQNAPKGYSNDHPHADLLKRKQLFFMHKYSNDEVLSADFAQKVVSDAKILKPYLDFLNYIFFEESDE